MKLYELSEAYRNLFDSLEDNELDEERTEEERAEFEDAWFSGLVMLDGLFDEKAASIGAWVKELEADAKEMREAEKPPRVVSLFRNDLGAAAGFGAALGEAQGEKILLLADDETEQADEVITVCLEHGSFKRVQILCCSGVPAALQIIGPDDEITVFIGDLVVDDFLLEGN